MVDLKAVSGPSQNSGVHRSRLLRALRVTELQFSKMSPNLEYFVPLEHLLLLNMWPSFYLEVVAEAGLVHLLILSRAQTLGQNRCSVNV